MLQTQHLSSTLQNSNKQLQITHSTFIYSRTKFVGLCLYLIGLYTLYIHTVSFV